MGVVRFAMLMRVAGNSLGAEGGAAVGRSLTALTALQSLDLSCNAACFVMLFTVRKIVSCVSVLPFIKSSNAVGVVLRVSTNST